MAEANKDLIEALKKIPVFQGLSPSQVHKVLNLCASRSYEPNDKLCVRGLPSDELYILIEGTLDIITEDGKHVAQITPITTIGELGVITGHNRTATVEVTQSSKVLVLQRTHLEMLLRKEPAIRAKTYQNVIGILSDKLVNDNIRMRDHLEEKARFERRLADLERSLTVACDLLIEMGVEPDVLNLTLAERLEEMEQQE